MDNQSPKKESRPDIVSETGTVTPAMVRKRASELAVIDGRDPHEATEADHERARRQLLGEPEEDEIEAVLEALPESARWDPVPGTPGQQAPEIPSEDDEDEDGRNESARLAEGGMVQAEDELAAEAEKSVAKRPRPKP